MFAYALIIFIVGTFFGSFFNVVIYRLPLKKSIVFGSSSCTSCNTPIKAYDLIPVLSYLGLKGKCRHCNASISMRYPLIELLTGFTYLLLFLQFDFTMSFYIGIVLTSLLIILAMIDIDTMEIPDRFHIMIFILALINLAFNDFSIYSHIGGFFIISVPLFVIALITGGLGGGDIKLIAVAGFLLGTPSTLVAFMIASIFGGLVALYLLIFKKESRKTAIAFGPYLCVGIYVAYLYGPNIINWYVSLFF